MILHLEAKTCSEARSAQSSNCAEANAALRRATNGLKELDKAHIYMGHQPKNDRYLVVTLVICS